MVENLFSRVKRSLSSRSVENSLKINRSKTPSRVWPTVHVVLWLSVIAITIFLLDYYFSTQFTLLIVIANFPILILAFYVNVWLVDRLLEKKRYVYFALSTTLLWIATSWLRIFIKLMLPDPPILLNLPYPASRITVLVWLTMFITLLISTLYRLLENRYLEEWHSLQKINEFQSAQLTYLKAQINPHFLFNTLNNIYSLALVKSDLAPHMILRLSELLRYSIYESKQEKVLLSSEIAQIQKYIELYQMRSEDPLSIHFQEPPREAAQDFWIEPMLLLPLVENCFKHGDFDTNPQAYARVAMHLNQNAFIFQTENSKDSSPQEKDQVGGVGLANIQERLALNYGKRASLVVQDFHTHFQVKLQIQHT